MDQDIKAIQSLVRRKWKNGSFIEKTDTLPHYQIKNSWIKYESYMQAQLIDCVPYQVGILLVRFPQ